MVAMSRGRGECENSLGFWVQILGGLNSRMYEGKNNLHLSWGPFASTALFQSAPSSKILPFPYQLLQLPLQR